MSGNESVAQEGMSMFSQARFRSLILLALLLSACGASTSPSALNGRGDKAQEPAGPLLLFEDDFSDPGSGWLEASDAQADQGYRGGKLFFAVQAADLLVWDNPGGNFQDFALEVEAWPVSGGPENSYGVLIRYVDDGNFYRFDLSGDGYYALSKLENEEWIMLADWQASAHVKPQGEVNLIKIVCRGPKMTFYVNGQELIGVEDDSFERGDVGLFASTFTDPNIEVEFDNLEIWELEGE